MEYVAFALGVCAVLMGGIGLIWCREIEKELRWKPTRIAKPRRAKPAVERVVDTFEGGEATDKPKFLYDGFDLYDPQTGEIVPAKAPQGRVLDRTEGSTGTND